MAASERTGEQPMSMREAYCGFDCMERQCSKNYKKDLNTQKYLRRLMELQLIEGVGLEGDLLPFGRHTSWPSSPSSFLAFWAFRGEVECSGFEAGMTNSGNLPMGSPCPLLASLNLVSWLIFTGGDSSWECFLFRNYSALLSTPQMFLWLEKRMSPWDMDLNISGGIFCLFNSLSFDSIYYFRSKGSARCFRGLKSSLSTLLIGFVVKFLAMVAMRPESSLFGQIFGNGLSSMCLQGETALSRMQFTVFWALRKGQNLFSGWFPLNAAPGS